MEKIIYLTLLATSFKKMAIIALEGMIFHSNHGVFPEEKVLGGKYEIDIYMDVDTEVAAISDDIHDTVNYKHVYDITDKLIKTRHKLIEALAYKLAINILEAEPKVKSVKTRVSKHQPPLGGLCSRTFVEYEKNRE